MPRAKVKYIYTYKYICVPCVYMVLSLGGKLTSEKYNAWNGSVKSDVEAQFLKNLSTEKVPPKRKSFPLMIMILAFGSLPPHLSLNIWTYV